METPFEGRDVLDLSLEDEYLSPAMFDSVPLCAGFDDFVSNDFRSQAHQSAYRTTVNGFGMDELDNANYGAVINPDDFLNDVSSDSLHSLSNRDTPSPSDSQKSYDSVPSSGGFDRCHVVPMHLDSPPISPPASTISMDSTSTVKPTCGPRRLKIIPKSVSSSSSGTKTITKKTIVLSAKDYRALLANMQRQPSSNTIILKATPTNKLPIGVSAVKQPLPTAPHVLKQEAPFVLPKPTEISREIELKQETTSPAAIKEESVAKSF
uniref:Uncharacterized protein n=1 Tax=Anopheles maculatus TaxID=74869 RepID=A0A182SMU9_9DIPT